MESVISTRFTDVLTQRQLTTIQTLQRRTELVYTSKWVDVHYHSLVTTIRQLTTTYQVLVISLACLACLKKVDYLIHWHVTTVKKSLVSTLMMNGELCAVIGCTTPSACNFDPEADLMMEVVSTFLVLDV